MATIADEDWAKVNPRTAKMAGYSGLIGYVSEDTTGKNWTASTLKAARDAGMDVGVVYEYGTKQPLGGAGQGTRDGHLAAEQASSLGFPRGVVIYVAVDFDVQPVDLPVVLRYVQAFRDAVSAYGYRAGVYGGYFVCQAAHYNNLGVKLWQTFAWSNGMWSVAADVRQVHNGVHVAGATVDQDQTMTVDWGQWSADGRYPSATKGEDVSVKTDNLVAAFMEGDPQTVDESGRSLVVAPVTWRQRDEAWQAGVNAVLASLTSAVAKLGSATGGLTDAEAADLHVIASVLRPPTT
jgi:hypothetical protein